MEEAFLDDKDGGKDIPNYNYTSHFTRSRIRMQIPGMFHTGDICCRVVTGALGVLCMLLLTVVIVLSVERSHLDSTFRNLTSEKDLLSSDFDSLKVESAAVKSRLSDLEKHLNEGWIFFQSSLYYISHDTMQWRTARDDCLRRQADLVIINNRDEQQFLTDLQKEFWIGLTDCDGTWKWLDGTLVNPSTTWWDSGQPNSYAGNEDCAEIRVRGSLTNWNDDLCTRAQLWACEKTDVDI
ncbi:C-type lectin domain family 4 member E-like [Engraulis encrasicolus]|uniref:C-type lectin domain family 4 member E-like n=1 Tax=Engraulis encrasicolus TaxID=184585 RepID=UPI002FD6C3A0